MQLPNLKARVGPSEETDWVREGWDRRGARSRLDRAAPSRNGEAARQSAATPTFIDEDLRYRQLARRRQPAVHAVVFFMLDVSGSMSDRDRKLAKTFFFWVVQALRRDVSLAGNRVRGPAPPRLGSFTSRNSFQVSGHRRHAVSSTGFNKVREIIDARYNPGELPIFICSRASDGDNSVSDSAEARETLSSINRGRLLHRLRRSFQSGCRANSQPEPGGCSPSSPPAGARPAAMRSRFR